MNKKLRRKQAQFLKQEPTLNVKFLDSPSQSVFVGNGGTQNGLSHELLLCLLKEILHPQPYREGLALCLPVAKDYCFMHLSSISCAHTVVDSLNGVCLQEFCRSRGLDSLLPPSILAGFPLHLYLCYVDRIPPVLLQRASQGPGDPSSELPAGLVLVDEFVSLEEETELLSFFVSLPPTHQSVGQSHTVEQSGSECDNTTGKDFTGTGECTPHSEEPAVISCQGQTLSEAVSGRDSHDSPESELGVANPTADSTGYQAPSAILKHRWVKHYGYEFLYGRNNVDPDAPLPGGIPEVCRPLLDRLLETGYVYGVPDQLTVNEYSPGAGIPPHVDTHSAFEDGIVSVTLGSQTVMDFKHTDGRKVSVFLPRRSVLIMTGESRYLWTHGIPARKTDVVHPSMPGYSLPPSSPPSEAEAVRVLPRGTRVSLTFRRLKRPPNCSCCYPQQCDSQHSAS